MSRRKRVISYVRVVWPGANGAPSQSLGEALHHCLAELPTAKNTVLDAKAGRAAIRHRHPRLSRASNSGLLLLHICTWVPKQRASTVPHGGDGPSADLAFHEPSDKWDYLIGDGMVLVSENDCLVMQSQRLRQTTMQHYLSDLLEHGRRRGASIDPAMKDFSWLTISDSLLAQEIKRAGGITKLHLPFGHYHETATHIANDNVHVPIAARLRQLVVDALGLSDETRERILAADNLNAHLVMSVDGRRLGLFPEDLTDAAEPILRDHYAEVTLELANGSRIKQGNLVLRKKANVEHEDDRANYGDAWEAMREFFQELIRTGAINR